MSLSDQIVHSLELSLLVATLSTFLVTLIGGFLAYFLAMNKFRFKSVVEVLCLMPLVLPPTVIGYYLILFFGREGILGQYIYSYFDFSIMFTWYAAVLASFVVSLPLMIKTTQSAIEAVDKNLIDSSYVLGYGKIETALRVIFPLAKRGMLAGIILSFARGLGEFGATLMVAGNIPGKTDTLPLAIYSAASSGEWKSAHLIVLSLTLLSALFIFLSNSLSRRVRV